jgi:hypothetical protein
MTNPIRLSGYTAQPALQQQTLTWTNPAQWIQETAQDMPLALATQKGSAIESQLEVANACAQEILHSVGPGRAVDTQGVLIHNSTQIDELMQLSADLQSIEQNVRSSLKKDRNLTQYAQGFLNKRAASKRLTAECDSLANLARQMQGEAALLEKQIKIESNNVTNKLLETTPLPKDCLEIITQYTVL